MGGSNMAYPIHQSIGAAGITAYGSQVSPGVPAETADGDRLIGFVGCDYTRALSSVESWPSVASDDYTNNVSGAVFSKVAGASESDPSFAIDAGNETIASIVARVTGADAITGVATTGAGMTLTFPAAGTASGDSLVYRVAMIGSGADYGLSMPGTSVYNDNTGDVSSSHVRLAVSYEQVAQGQTIPAATASQNTAENAVLMTIVVSAAAVNQAPVADDNTYSIAENAQNGDVVGTYTATDSDGTVVGYSITGTQLAIDNAGQITLIDNAGLTAGQQIVETVTATDDDGATDPATITVNITAVALSYSVDNANPEAGETVTLTIANGTGPYTAEFDGSAIALATQNASGATIAWPNMQTHGSRYNQAADLVLTDTSNGQTHTVQITPAVTAGHDFAVITAMTGIGADDTDVVVGDERVGYVVSGTFEHVDLATGALMSAGGGTYRYNTYDVSAGAWLGAVDEVIAAPDEPPVNNPATGQPTITGTPQVGSTLTADTSNVADADGLGTLNIQWLLDGSPINGATNTTYVPVAGDVGSDLTYDVSFTDGEGNAEGPLTSTAVTIQAAPVSNTPTSGLPVITGTTQVGQQLGVDTSALADVDGLGAFTYSWILDGSEVGTAATYTPNTTGSLLVRVSHTDGGGTVETVSSAAVTVQPTPAGITEDSGNPIPASITVPAGGSYDLKQHFVIPSGSTAVFTVISGLLGQGVSMTSLGVLSNTGAAATTNSVTFNVEAA